MTSSKPSPLTSPAALTERPDRSSSDTPSRRKPVVPSRDERSMVDEKPLALPKTT